MKLVAAIRDKWQPRPLTALAIGSGLGAATGLGALPWWCAIVLPLCALLLSLRRFTLLATGFALALVSGYVHFCRTAAMETKLPVRPFGAEGSFLCTDTRCSRLPDLEMPKQLRGLLTLPEIGSFPVTATFPEKTPRPFFGDCFTVSGQCYPPSPSALIADAHGKIIGQTEPPFGKSYRMRIQSAELRSRKSGFRRALLLWRDGLLKRLLAHIPESRMRSQTARLFLGASAGAPAEVRNRYVSAGTIHLFAVSGMHVAVLAGLLLFLLRPLPFRIRCCAVGVLVWLYVFCTGGAYSAIRAGAMISAWAFCRALLLYSPGWNMLCLGWSVILWFDPKAVTELGVQYSFAITAALILGAERFREFRRHGDLPLGLMTERNAETEIFRRKHHRMAKYLALPFSAGIAFAASSGISLYAQSLFAPGGIAANLFLPLLTPPLFAAMIGKMLFGWIAPVIDRLGAGIITVFFALLDQLCEAVMTLFGRISAVRPALWEIGIFYAALFFALGSRRFRPALFGGTAALLLLLSWPIRGTLHQPELWVLSPGCDRPAMIVQIPCGSERARICNVPDFNCGITASQAMRQLGVTESEVWLTSGTIAAGSGLAALRSGGLKISKLHLPPKSSPALRSIIERSAPEQIVEESVCSFGVMVETESGDGGRRIRLKTAEREYRVTLPWSVPPVWYRVQSPR